ncbi:MAG: RNA polymerase factor sigma-54 [Candidatus Fermentithermobacillus carboniphilus]|uniref:RNA polymerase factor sigma-54 n=1 Tax=Candidatus Fermentithermobacillus carboniphilus TaxID=3085328 RepID=A0AAT9LA97_9FIRM|nr:MAG: RNA polymerase factor sigma-54 [Candidatus Fermentithermobacillus carboniphilus]
MKPGYGLELVQTQKLILTPELRQAIMVLQMNALELRDFIREETEKNPLLEVSDEREEDVSSEELEPANEEDWIAYFCDSSDLGLGQGLGQTAKHEIPPSYETLTEKEVTLREHLLSQLGLLHLGKEEYELGEFIVGNLDDNGYLRCSVAEIAIATGKSKKVVESMLKVIQSLDPPGVGARDLRECLALQAAQRGFGYLARHIIDAHLDDLAKGRYSKIAQEEKVSLKEVLSARDLILSLDPKPGSRFSSGGISYVVPDILVKKIDGEFVVILNDNALPTIRWNSFYRKLLIRGEKDAKAYLLEQFKKAQALFRSIEQRRLTISRVMESIVRRQRQFFDKGPCYLEPMSLKDIAEELGIHESTVSRAISNKYVDTPFGVFPCKMFFSPKIRSEHSNVSQYSVKRLIEEMVKNEDPRDPLSDQDIADRLSGLGVHVARRTVVKYRSQLGIPPSNRRKKL